MEEWRKRIITRSKKLMIIGFICSIIVIPGTVFFLAKMREAGSKGGIYYLVGFIALFLFTGCVAYGLNSLKLISVFSNHLDQIVWVYLKETKHVYENMPQVGGTTFEIMICLINGRKYEYSLADNQNREAAESIIFEIRESVPWALVGRYTDDLDEVFKENPYLFRHKYGKDPN